MSLGLTLQYVPHRCQDRTLVPDWQGPPQESSSKAQLYPEQEGLTRNSPTLPLPSASSCSTLSFGLCPSSLAATSCH